MNANEFTVPRRATPRTPMPAGVPETRAEAAFLLLVGEHLDPTHPDFGDRFECSGLGHVFEWKLTAADIRDAYDAMLMEQIANARRSESDVARVAAEPYRGAFMMRQAIAAMPSHLARQFVSTLQQIRALPETRGREARPRRSRAAVAARAPASRPADDDPPRARALARLARRLIAALGRVRL